MLDVIQNASSVYNNHLEFLNKYILKSKPLSTLETSIKRNSTPKLSSSFLTMWFLLEETIAQNVKIMHWKTGNGIKILTPNKLLTRLSIISANKSWKLFMKQNNSSNVKWVGITWWFLFSPRYSRL